MVYFIFRNFWIIEYFSCHSLMHFCYALAAFIAEWARPLNCFFFNELRQQTFLNFLLFRSIFYFYGNRKRLQSNKSFLVMRGLGALTYFSQLSSVESRYWNHNQKVCRPIKGYLLRTYEIVNRTSSYLYGVWRPWNVYLKFPTSYKCIFTITTLFTTPQYDGL